MKFRFFSIPARSPEPAEQALNAFCAEHRVLSVEKALVADGGESYWAASRRSANRNRNELGNRNENVGFCLARARARTDAVLDQTIIPSAAMRRRKAKALRQVSRSRTESLPQRRHQGGV